MIYNVNIVQYYKQMIPGHEYISYQKCQLLEERRVKFNISSSGLGITRYIWSSTKVVMIQAVTGTSYWRQKWGSGVLWTNDWFCDSAFLFWWFEYEEKSALMLKTSCVLITSPPNPLISHHWHSSHRWLCYDSNFCKFLINGTYSAKLHTCCGVKNVLVIIHFYS